MRKLGGLKLILIGVAIGALTFGAIAAQAADKYDNRPFSGAGTGNSTGQAGGGGQVSSVSTGNLNATHIGSSTYTITSNQDYERMMGEQDHTVGNCAFVEDSGNGDMGVVITAANGDQIHGDIDDDRSVICAPNSQMGVPMVNDVYLSTLYIEVVGGTGRFSDASGWLFSRGESTLTSVNLITGESTSSDQFTILGDIDY